MTHARANEYVQELVAACRDSKPKTDQPTDDNVDCGYWDAPEPDAGRVDYEGDHEDAVLGWFPGSCFECGEVGHRGL